MKLLDNILQSLDMMPSRETMAAVVRAEAQADLWVDNLGIVLQAK